MTTGELLHILSCSAFVLYSGIGFSQNLVPNSSFECGKDMCEAESNPDLFGSWACGWESPTTGTPDIFSTNLNCSSTLPNSIYYFLGSQLPRTGSRFSGVYTFQVGRIHHEYMQVTLHETLVPGRKYCAKMYVSRASRMKYASNNIGMYFGPLDDNTDSKTFLALTPQIEAKQVITSTSWFEIGGGFEVSAPTNNLVIGNFETDDNTQVIDEGGIDAGNNSISMAAYYFIDDVSVEPVPANILFSGATAICDNEKTNLSVNQELQQIRWYALNDPSQTISTESVLRVRPSGTTTYHVEGRTCGFSLSDTITVHVKTSPHIAMAKDTSLCLNETITLDPGAGFLSYQWQDLSTSQTLQVTQAGTYTVTVSNNLGCHATESALVKYKTSPVPNLGADTLICNSIYSLSAGKGDLFEWSTGARDSVITLRKFGKYWVTAQNRCGIGSDTVQLFFISDLFLPNVVTLNDDKQNDRFRFTGIGNNYQANFKIFNRWGKEIYSKRNYHDEWPLPSSLPDSGNYYFSLEFIGCRTYRGWLQVIR